ncbi:NACHT, LRR and PYD domains-containing protein 3-like [Antedon mediterranea]|uniref:NACHT, LRR and PYD domains-containing protein 3-like n=1 Tax=Antedon mediterranea TaxID=105859 RepID=UPI003AF8BF5B
MREKYKVDISQMFTDMELIKEFENNKGSKPTTLEEMVDIISSTPGCKALIEGEGGIGKTTILRHISYTWATHNKSNNVLEGKIVFLLCVRDLEKDEDIFDLIVKQLDMTDFNLDTDLPKDSRVIKKFIKKHDNKVVLLLDGLDELRFNNQSVISLFRKNSLKKSTVILTSRSENIDEFKKECNIHVRVKGFNEESIGKYINKHFKYFENPEMGKSLRRELDMYQGWQRKHEDVYSMCKNPMLLLSICILWEDNQSLPEDKTDLFKEFFRSILNQFHKQKFKDTREKFPKISKFEETPANYVNSMILLGKCMYKSLKENQLSINMKDLKDTQSTTDMIDMAVKLGFVYEEAPISKSNFERMFMPPHKLIVESLVGFYLCKLCESECIENECTEDVRRILTPLDDNEWEVIRESSYLDLARRFAIGFLGDKAYAFFNHWITNNLSTYRSLPRYLDCVKKPHKDVVINKLINHMESKDLEINNHLDDISTSIRTFIDHISPGVPCDGHFIRLIMQISCIENVADDIIHFICENRMTGEFKGKVIAHIVAIAAECDEDQIIPDLAGHIDTFNHFVTECSLKQVQLALERLDIDGNNLHNLDVNSLSSLLIMCPKLEYLYMSNCNLSGDVINHFVTECSLKQVQLALERLDISHNNFHNIDVNSMSSLLIMCPKLDFLCMSDCNLSGDVINHLGTECSLKQVQLALRRLYISDNNFHNLDVNSLSSLLIMCPKLTWLDMRDCNLSGDVINHLGTECSLKQVQLALRRLSISDNNLHNLDVNSLSSLLIMCPKLTWLDMRDCNLSGDVINHLGTECSLKQVQLALRDLVISGNNLHNLDVNSLSSLLNMCPKLKELYMINCKLSGDVINHLGTECSLRQVKLALHILAISGNNFHNLDVNSLSSFLIMCPELWRLDMSDCNLSVDAIKHIDEECSNRNIRFYS